MYTLSSSKKNELLRWYLSEYGIFIPEESRYILNKILKGQIESIDDLKKFDVTNEEISFQFDSINNRGLIKGSIENIISSLNIEINRNKNYLFPADPHIFNTNIYSLSHGCFGVLYALLKLQECYEFDYSNFERKCLSIILPKFMEEMNTLPKGLFIGTSGIAWVLLEMGYLELAESVMKYSNNVEEVTRKDYYYGLSGILLTNLKFYITTKSEYYRKIATNIYQKLNLLQYDDIVENGFGEGFSGIALTLLYYGVIFNVSEAIMASEKYLNYELERCQYDDREKISINREGIQSNMTIFSPYLYDGTAGLGVALIRFYKVTGKSKYLEKLEEIVDSCLFDATLFPTYNRGMSGLVDFLMDSLFVLGENSLKVNILDKLEKMSKNLQLFYNDSEKLFFGEQLLKLSTDLTAGTSGIILTLNRYEKFIETGELDVSSMFYLDNELGLKREVKN